MREQYITYPLSFLGFYVVLEFLYSCGKYFVKGYRSGRQAMREAYPSKYDQETAYLKEYNEGRFDPLILKRTYLDGDDEGRFDPFLLANRPFDENGAYFDSIKSTDMSWDKEGLSMKEALENARDIFDDTRLNKIVYPPPADLDFLKWSNSLYYKTLPNQTLYLNRAAYRHCKSCKKLRRINVAASPMGWLQPACLCGAPSYIEPFMKREE